MLQFPLIDYGTAPTSIGTTETKLFDNWVPMLTLKWDNAAEVLCIRHHYLTSIVVVFV